MFVSDSVGRFAVGWTGTIRKHAGPSGKQESVRINLQCDAIPFSAIYISNRGCKYIKEKIQNLHPRVSHTHLRTDNYM